MGVKGQAEPATFGDAHKLDPISGLVGGVSRSELESEAYRLDILRFFLEQMKLRGVIGMRLSGAVKDDRGYPDVVFGRDMEGVAVWVYDPQAGMSGEVRSMLNRMKGQWRCQCIGSRDEGMKLLCGRLFWNKGDRH